MVSKLIKPLIFISLVYISCEQKPQEVDTDILSEKQFISEYRLGFFLSFLSLATNNTIGKSLDSLNDWSYQGDGGYLPRKYNEQVDSLLPDGWLSICIITQVSIIISFLMQMSSLE